MRNSFLILIAYTFFNNIYTFENYIKFKLLKFLINIKNFKLIKKIFLKSYLKNMNKSLILYYKKFFNIFYGINEKI